LASHRFVVNFRSETASAKFRGALPTRSYLVPGNSSDTVRKAARAMTEEARDIYADNGYFDNVGLIARDLATEAQPLIAEVRKQEALLNRNVHAGELKAITRDGFRILAARARAEARIVTSQRDSVLMEQRKSAPTYWIGAEDITMAVWLALGIETEYLALPARIYRRINNRTARRATLEMSHLAAPESAGYYAVASAMNYNTARDAGRVLADNGVTRVAMGFGAYMADDSYTDHVDVGRRRLTLSARMPNRYLRTALVARGFWDGYREVSGSAPQGFHFLGLGAPIMMGLVALAGWGTPQLTFDATSPIRDAADGTLYVSVPAPLKVRARRVAGQLASGQRTNWDCPCRFCQQFMMAHPFDYAAGHNWFALHPNQEPTASELRPSGALYDAFPLLGEPKSGPLRRSVTFARMGHNHWAISKVTGGLNAASGSQVRLEAHVGNIVERYEAATAAPRFGAAVRFAYEIVTGSRDL
jgi:hypothetical protein